VSDFTLRRSNDLLESLAILRREGVFVTCLTDCCHLGTVLDLPFNLKADGDISPNIILNSEIEDGDCVGAAQLTAVECESCCVIS